MLLLLRFQILSRYSILVKSKAIYYNESGGVIMVLYFSATGNTKYVAETLAKGLGDTAENLLERIQRQDYSPIHSDRPFVICSPIIVCEMPRFLNAWLKKAVFTGSRELYFVFTSGGYAGISGFQGKQLARRKRMHYMGRAELKMPRNYIASDAYPELSKAEIEERIRDTTKRMPVIISTVQSGEKLTARHVWLFELLVTLPFNPVWSRFKQCTRDFHVTEKCIACGRCERGCPMNIIQLDKQKRPVWIRSTCSHCMACIQSCPVSAIEYGHVTQAKQRYRFENYKYAAENS